ncbi:asparagine synthase (glutamine-hydrolyzing) [Nonomuraea sp. MG754425]|uniref:asparagine synthase (glutamine-hydrolyzing) n=1 Tax=Nonomuraea sp. MG754425 TaxID=2570319 RepID=UPI001F00C65A|nr:asparagine synthase (glutamine-hydrolyzing) [Nonomuraea sp. MG754425]MCF6473363.1 asparagine synthase (glutamine-hydrolyzing) [Nonomuraea sp. MG754425]
MCGIAGIYHFGGGPPVEPRELSAMGAALAHRGPDQAGTWRAPDGLVGLAHRRLAVIDPTAGAGQPMSDGDGTLHVVLNGVLCNHVELRARLEGLGHRFRTRHSDTEVLLHAYARWGVECVHRLRGMFAFALWDGRARSLWLARDRMGIKPLHYRVGPASLTFASEVGSLVAGARSTPVLRRQSVYDHLTYLGVPAPYTMFEDVWKLPPGTMLVADERGVRTRPYWDAAEHLNDPAPAAECGPPGEAVEETRSMVRAAVRLHVRSDVPVASTLSAGVDAALVTACARRETSGLAAFVADFETPSPFGESGGAADMAARLGVPLHVHTVDARGFHDVFAALTRHLREGPVGAPDAVVMVRLGTDMRRLGFKVCLVGEGGDEIGGGYPSYLRDPVDGTLPRRHIQAFSEADKRTLWRGGPVTSSYDALAALVGQIDPQLPDAFHRATLNAEFKLRLPDFLLPRVDLAMMAAGVEARVPLLDHPLVERSLRLPVRATWFDGRPKYLLRRTLAGEAPGSVPPGKLGFGRMLTPMFERDLPGWVAGGLLSRPGHPLFDLVDPAAVRALHDGRGHVPDAPFKLWTLYALGSWLETL